MEKHLTFDVEPLLGLEEDLVRGRVEVPGVDEALQGGKPALEGAHGNPEHALAASASVAVGVEVAWNKDTCRLFRDIDRALIIQKFLLWENVFHPPINYGKKKSKIGK